MVLLQLILYKIYQNLVYLIATDVTSRPRSIEIKHFFVLLLPLGEKSRK